MDSAIRTANQRARLYEFGRKDSVAVGVQGVRCFQIGVMTASGFIFVANLTSFELSC
jgi:hypothetical protein